MIAAVQVSLLLVASILIGAFAVIAANIHIAGWAKRAPKEKKDWIGLLQTTVMLSGVIPSFFLMMRAGTIVLGNHGRPSSTVFMLILPVMLIWFFGLVGLAYVYERKVYNPGSSDRSGT